MLLAARHDVEGDDVEAHDLHWTVLHAAAWYGRASLLRNLLSNQDARDVINPLDLLAFDSNDRTPAQLAASAGHLPVLDVLVELDHPTGRQSLVCGQSGEFDSAVFHHAAAEGNVDVVRWFLRRFPKDALRLEGDESATWIDTAIEHGQEQVVAVLVEAFPRDDPIWVPADPNLNVLHLAIEEGQESIFRMLLRHLGNEYLERDEHVREFNSAFRNARELLEEQDLQHWLGADA